MLVQTRLSSRTVPSREVPGRSRDGTGRDGTGRDLETLKVPWSLGPGTKEVQNSRYFFQGPGTSRPLFPPFAFEVLLDMAKK
jgi:hypothetical protein